MSDFIVGLDLGQSQDYTAVCVVQRVPQMELVEVELGGGAVDTVRQRVGAAHYHCRHLERYALGTRYPDIVGKVAGLLQTPTLRGAQLVVDATGVGRGIYDMFSAAGLAPVGVLVTGGDAVNHTGDFWKIPKRDLVASVQAPLQDKRLKFAEGLTLAPTLITELLNFRVRISESAHDSYGAWRENEHDDLAFALMLACWWTQEQERSRGMSDEEFMSLFRWQGS